MLYFLSKIYNTYALGCMKDEHDFKSHMRNHVTKIISIFAKMQPSSLIKKLVFVHLLVLIVQREEFFSTQVQLPENGIH